MCIYIHCLCVYIYIYSVYICIDMYIYTRMFIYIYTHVQSLEQGSTSWTIPQFTLPLDKYWISALTMISCIVVYPQLCCLIDRTFHLGCLISKHTTSFNLAGNMIAFSLFCPMKVMLKSKQHRLVIWGPQIGVPHHAFCRYTVYYIHFWGQNKCASVRKYGNMFKIIFT